MPAPRAPIEPPGKVTHPRDPAGASGAGIRDALLRLARGGLFVLRRAVDAVCILLLLSMTALIFAQICGRYVFNYSIAWSEEAAIFAQVWLVMLGAGIAMRERSHVAVDVLIALCPAWLQRIAKAASFVLGAWLLVVIIVGSFSLIAIGQIVKSTALQLPLAIPYAALPIGIGYFLLEFTLATLPEIRDPSGRRTVPREDG